MLYLLLRIRFVMRTLYFLGGGDLTVVFFFVFLSGSAEHFTVAMTKMAKVRASV